MSAIRQNAISHFSRVVIQAKECEELKAKYKSLTSLTSRRASSLHIMVADKSQQILKKKLGIYEKEYAQLSNRLVLPSLTETQLEDNVKRLQSELAVLQKENKRLNQCKFLTPRVNLSSIKLEIEESHRQIKSLNAQINEIMVSIEENPKESRDLDEKIMKLQEKYEKIQRKAEIYKKNRPNKAYFKRLKKLDVLIKSWKANVARYEQRISDMEVEAEELRQNHMQIKAKSFKKLQQQRLLKMSFDEVMSKRDLQSQSVKPDIHHPGVGFMYKPSVKSLYNI